MALKALGVIAPYPGPKSPDELFKWTQNFALYFNRFLYAIDETLDAILAGSITATELSSGSFQTVTSTANVAIDSAATITFTVTAGHTPIVTARCTALLWTVHVATVTTAQVTVIATNRTLSTAGVTVYVDYYPAAP